MKGDGLLTFCLHFDICALLVIALVLVSFYIKRRASAFKSRIFEVLIWTGGLATVADIWTVILGDVEGMLTAKWLLNMSYYLLHSSTMFFIVSYFVVMAEPIVRMTLKRKCQLALPIVLLAILIAFNPMLKLLFYFDENGIYHRGKFIWIGYAVAGYYLIFMLIFILRHTEFFERTTRIVVYISTFLSVIPSAIQLSNSSVLVECFGAALYIAMISMLYQANDASSDNSTGLLSRQAFESDCKAYTSTGMNFSVLIVKLRDAKFLSEMFGQQFSLKVNAAFANYISKYVRRGNAFSLGNGAFALCFVNESAEPKFVMDSIGERMKEQWGFEEIKTMLSASMCLVSFPQHAPDFHGFIDLVDEVVSNTSDKSNVIYVDSIEVTDRRRRMSIDRTLRSENVTRVLEVVYQPIYSQKTSRFTHAEALVRLRDPILGYVMPDEFIPIAEKNGTMFRIGEYVIDNVCKLLANGKTDDAGIELIGINLSVSQCMQTDLVSQIASIVQKYDVSPTSICFEITEKVGENPPDIVINNLRELNSLGFKFAIDDFGTGTASMQRLMMLPIGFIKIDKSFIEDAIVSKKTRILLQNSIDIAKSIRLEVVAEGIETEEMAQQVCDAFSVDLVQGFYYSQPCKGLELPFTVKRLNNGEREFGN